MSANGKAKHYLHCVCIKPSAKQQRPFCKSFGFTGYKEYLQSLSTHS